MFLENELRGAGVYTDDIGRIVAGPDGYNTAEGIMAGYNAAQMTDKTFDKRTDTIANTLSNKYGIDINDPSFDPSTIDEDDAAYDLVNRYGLINQAKTNFFNTKKKADEIYEFEKQQKEIEKQKSDPNILSPNNPLIGKIDHTGGGITRDPGSKVEGAPTHRTRDDLMATGGRVGLRYGGLLSIL